MVQKKGFIYSFIFNQKTLAVLGLILIVLIAIPLVKNINQRRAVDKEIKDMQEEITARKNKDSDLRQLMNYLESDQYLEKQARLNFGLKKKGEEVIVIKDGNSAGASLSGKGVAKESSGISEIPPVKSAKNNNLAINPQRWWSYFLERE